MGYHAASDRPILVTGPGREVDAAQTWEWDDGWALAQDMGPRARFGCALSESHDGSLLLFGGALGVPMRDTWSWDGTTWTQVDDSGPGARSEAAMATDPVRKKDILFGGVSGGTDVPVQSETWTWDGSFWSPIDDSGPALNLPKLAWDTTTSTLVLVGSFGSSSTTSTYIWTQHMWVPVNDLGPDVPVGALLSTPVGVVAVTSTGTWTWNGTRNRWTQVQDVGPRSTELCGVWHRKENLGIVFDGAAGSTWRLSHD